MDLANILDYEKTYLLELVHPVTEKPTGVTMEIRSSASPEAKKVFFEEANRISERQQKGKIVKTEQSVKASVRRAASCIASWDWGTVQYDGEVPKLSMKTAMKILDEQDWIYDQVVEASTDLGNFTTISEKDSANTSAKA